jgi:hypothetical protein
VSLGLKSPLTIAAARGFTRTPTGVGGEGGWGARKATLESGRHQEFLHFKPVGKHFVPRAGTEFQSELEHRSDLAAPAQAWARHTTAVALLS